jgi:Fe-S-cluster containining protein
MKVNQEQLLPAIILREEPPYLEMMKKKQYSIGAFKNPRYRGLIEKINPSLSRIAESDEGACVFYNSINRRCSIYEYRPIACQLYPLGLWLTRCIDPVNIPANSPDILCPESCFSNIKEATLSKAIQQRFRTDLGRIFRIKQGSKIAFESNERIQFAFISLGVIFNALSNKI